MLLPEERLAIREEILTLKTVNLADVKVIALAEICEKLLEEIICQESAIEDIHDRITRIQNE